MLYRRERTPKDSCEGRALLVQAYARATNLPVPSETTLEAWATHGGRGALALAVGGQGERSRAADDPGARGATL